MVDVKTKKKRLLTSGDCYSPLFSPDGKSVALDFAGDEGYQIYVMDVASKRMSKVSKHKKECFYSARWSPDSKRLAYYSSGDKLLVADVKSGRQTVLAKGDKAVHPYAFSPSGRKLAFVADGKIRTVSLSGGKPRSIVSVPMGVHMISWATDGRTVIFDQQKWDGDNFHLKAIKAVNTDTKVVRTLKKW
jgi:Tol biopolymer transport system component